MLWVLWVSTVRLLEFLEYGGFSSWFTETQGGMLGVPCWLVREFLEYWSCWVLSILLVLLVLGVCSMIFRGGRFDNGRSFSMAGFLYGSF